MVLPETFERVFALIDPKQFERAFRLWVGRRIPALGQGQIVAIDGKSSRRTTSRAVAAPLYLVKSIKMSIKTKRLVAATSAEFQAALLGFEVHGRMTMNDECVTAGALPDCRIGTHRHLEASRANDHP